MPLTTRRRSAGILEYAREKRALYRWVPIERVNEDDYEDLGRRVVKVAITP
jgi:hypothetical protein